MHGQEASASSEPRRIEGLGRQGSAVPEALVLEDDVRCHIGDVEHILSEINEPLRRSFP